MRREQPINEYAEEKRWVFSFALKEVSGEGVQIEEATCSFHVKSPFRNDNDVHEKCLHAQILAFSLKAQVLRF